MASKINSMNQLFTDHKSRVELQYEIDLYTHLSRIFKDILRIFIQRNIFKMQILFLMFGTSYIIQIFAKISDLKKKCLLLYMNSL